ncbi:hypothetical protein AB0C96_14300 [Streptomyces sp. NPDC048506]|uniref:hypothetical protein n=1 Tax=Streptomyces sp. NPDC048506 TaxID=3155028 RepID=UPI003435C6D4
MTVSTPHGQTTEGADRPLVSRATRRALAGDLIRLGRVDGPRAGVSAAAVIEGYERAWHITDRWLPLAQERLRAASGSPADRARWEALVEAAARPDGCLRNRSFTGLAELAGHTRELLRTLRDTEPFYVPIAEVAARITEAVTHGNYLAGASLSPGRIAADLALPLASVKLALIDLADEGVVELSATGRARISGVGCADRPQQIAEWLRELIAAGAYPSGTRLPTRPVLARSLVSAEYPVAVAIRILTEDGTLICHPTRRPLVRPDHPTAGAQATDVTRAFAQLPHPMAPVDLSETGIREAARVAQSWWRARLAPHPATLDHHLVQLVAIARHLITRARRQATDAQREHLDGVVVRITASAAGVARADPERRIWRIACLAAALLDLLNLTTAAGGAAVPRRPHAAR